MIITSGRIIWMKKWQVECMDGTNFKIFMPNENHIYMDESYKNDGIFGWRWNMNELLDDK